MKNGLEAEFGRLPYSPFLKLTSFALLTLYSSDPLITLNT